MDNKELGRLKLWLRSYTSRLIKYEPLKYIGKFKLINIYGEGDHITTVS